MTQLIYILVVITLNGNSPAKAEANKFKNLDECYKAEFAVESMTNSFAKCVPEEIRID